MDKLKVEIIYERSDIREKNLIQLIGVSESEALKYISYGIKGDWEFFVMNSKENEFQLLTTGQLQQIHNIHPKKAIVYLEEFQLYITFNRSGNAVCIPERNDHQFRPHLIADSGNT